VHVVLSEIVVTSTSPVTDLPEVEIGTDNRADG
jgi:hypothetical protein